MAVRLLRGRPALMLGIALQAAVALGGCSYNLYSLHAKEDGDMTSALGRPAGTEPARAAIQPQEADLAYARAAAANALARGDRDSSTPWENPQTGASGNITPLASSYTEGGFTCRDFLASYVHAGSQGWMQGEACRTDHGKWQVKSLAPLTQN